jgi:proteic killer suppression protein
MNGIYNVSFSKQAQRDLKKIPVHIALKLQAWIEDLGHLGLSEVRKISGYRDEQLKGDRKGQRSIRLNKAYRAIYVVEQNGEVCLVEIIEVNKHEY